jgi:predicted  nucleic acid-binding Zn-ribbon protein
MSGDKEAEIAELVAELQTLRRDSARIVAKMHVGAPRKERRDLERQLAACRKRGKHFEPQVEALLPSAEGERKERLEKDAYFLSQLRTFGLPPEQTEEPA